LVVAWRDPRVKLFSQYIWIDEPLPGKGDYGGFQSGLRYANGTAKPTNVMLVTLRAVFFCASAKSTSKVTAMIAIHGRVRARSMITSRSAAPTRLRMMETS
jgi:hypothetical protein